MLIYSNNIWMVIFYSSIIPLLYWKYIIVYFIYHTEIQNYLLPYGSRGSPTDYDPCGSPSTGNGSHHWCLCLLEILRRLPRTQVVSSWWVPFWVLMGIWHKMQRFRNLWYQFIGAYWHQVPCLCGHIESGDGLKHCKPSTEQILIEIW